MTKAWIKKNLEAVRFLRSTYRLALEDIKKEDQESFRVRTDCVNEAYLKRPYPVAEPKFKCPLCSVNDMRCDKCPWTVFTEEAWCVTQKFFDDPIQSRIERLNDWEKRLLEMRR